jgi:hypothetical protein
MIPPPIDEHIAIDWFVRCPGGLAWEAYRGGRLVGLWFRGMSQWRTV